MAAGVHKVDISWDRRPAGTVARSCSTMRGD